MAKNADLIRRWFEEVWNQGREATIDDLCAKGIVGHGQTIDGSDIVGPETFKEFWRALRSGFASMRVEIHRTIEEGELVLAQWTFTMKHTGPFLGIRPTGDQVIVKGMSIQRFSNGQIVEAWDNWDQLGVLAQLGAVSLDKFALQPNRPEALSA